jgi:hypothetical protein
MRASFAEEMALAFCRIATLTAAQECPFDNQRLSRSLDNRAGPLLQNLHREYVRFRSRPAHSDDLSSSPHRSDVLVAPRELAWPLLGTLQRSELTRCRF